VSNTAYTVASEYRYILYNACKSHPYCSVDR